jgi:hypothetical protein
MMHCKREPTLPGEVKIFSKVVIKINDLPAIQQEIADFNYAMGLHPDFPEHKLNEAKKYLKAVIIFKWAVLE